MPELLGIENLKKLVKFSLDLTENIASALKDGKITTTEIFGFLPELMQVPGVVKSWKDITAELKELSPQDRQALYEYAADEFDLENKNVESFVEDALLQAISLISLVEKFKTLKQPPIN